MKESNKKFNKKSADNSGSLGIISDIHGNYETLDRIVKELNCEYILQLGDMGFNYESLDKYDPKKFKFIGGNHDDYDIYENNPYSLGDFGKEKLGDFEFFYIRGGFSIDNEYRKHLFLMSGKKTWWEKEQLDSYQMSKARNSYSNELPDIMITHSCPREIARQIGNIEVLKAFGFDETFSSLTQDLLQDCFDFHQPKVWIFGHMHQNIDMDYKGTRFICIDQLESLKIKSFSELY